MRRFPASRAWTVIATHRRSEAPKTLADLAAQYKKVRIEKLDVTDPVQADALALRGQRVRKRCLVDFRREAP